jgi:hypothetical protein
MRITTTIKLSDDLELEVKGFYTPEEPMVWTLPNGDPGYPGSESEFEINDIKITKGTLLDFIYATDGRQFVIDYLEELTIKQIEER